MEKELLEKFWNLDGPHYAAFLDSGKPFDAAKYFIHTHTDLGSPLDSVLTAKQYIDAAVRMGARAIAISDHGTMYGVATLNDLCKDTGIKLIVGCEFYVCENATEETKKKKTRLHLCIYAKDDIGYRTIAKLVTESNKRIITVKYAGKTQNYPCISKALLTEFVGPGSDGHGHVILTSACVGGVLAGIGYVNETEGKNVALMQKKLDEYNKHVELYKKISAVKDEMEEAAALIKKKEPLPVGFRVTAQQVPEMLKQAKKELKSIQGKMDTASGLKNCSLEYFTKYRDEFAADLNDLKAIIVNETDLEGWMSNEARWYDDIAGHGNFFIELQYHGLPEEKKFMPMLQTIADTMGLPTVAANDAHMLKRTDADLRQVINAMRFDIWDERDEASEELYLKTDQELFSALSKVVPKAKAWKAMLGRETLADMCTFQLKKEPKYPVYKTTASET